MSQTISISPKNSVVLVMDRLAGEIPSEIEGIVSCTNSCVAIGTLAEIDGVTNISFLLNAYEVQQAKLLFQGLVSTPNKKLSVCAVDLDEVMTISVNYLSTKVEIYANDEYEPGNIEILIDCTEHQHHQLSL
jgi:hypothetical protein